MSDDLVKRARHNALADMPHHASVELIEALADCIEELEAKLASCEKYRDAYNEMGRIGTEAYRDLDAKLARALEALEQIEDTRDTLGMIQRLRRQQSDMHTTLAELKGDPDAT